jgi:hypothetical protein
MAIRSTVAILEKFKDARVHYAVLKQRTNPPTTPGHHTQNHPPPEPEGPSSDDLSRYDRKPATRTPSRNTPAPLPGTVPHEGEQSRASRPVVSGPNSVLGRPSPTTSRVPTRDKHRRTSNQPASEQVFRQCSTHEQPPQTRTAWAWPLPPAPTTLHRPRRTHEPASVPTMWGLVEMSSLERR